ncbi:serine protease inhibitor Kazal-type 1 [Lingula anatina]|uniref:Serine protease inhibitor Kazal-type 1 n=1 Tax=Lingula anatina TaxID=7574 RepID=A0A1S3KAE6_LINAN|nr:serine protease inhibitor Kazal-type 1 [Lingula anatina]|eukprot:XP_013419414.1 serine protease inhibitor Kazal-type 1 [Lingula anatina]
MHWITLALLFLSATLALCNEEYPRFGCAKYDEIIRGCEKIYRPVCGTNGKTYGNECMLCLEMKQRQAMGENIIIGVAADRRCEE